MQAMRMLCAWYTNQVGLPGPSLCVATITTSDSTCSQLSVSYPPSRRHYCITKSRIRCQPAPSLTATFLMSVQTANTAPPKTAAEPHTHIRERHFYRLATGRKATMAFITSGLKTFAIIGPMTTRLEASPSYNRSELLL